MVPSPTNECHRRGLEGGRECWRLSQDTQGEGTNSPCMCVSREWKGGERRGGEGRGGDGRGEERRGVDCTLIGSLCLSVCDERGMLFQHHCSTSYQPAHALMYLRQKALQSLSLPLSLIVYGE